MRLPFLILTPACVVLGLGTAVWSFGDVSVFHFVLALVGGISAHISVNAFNEYFDFRSGLDFKTQRTPFSGGSGTLPAKPELARQALTTAIVSFAVVCLIGLYFLSVRGMALLPLGVAGLLVVVVYTPWLAHNPYICLIAPGLGFGSLMVVGTHFVLTGEYSWTAFIASFVPFFLVSNLLLLNQFPDVEADRSVGRKNFPIVVGRRASSLIYGVFLLLAFLTIVLGVLLEYLPAMSLIGLIALGLALPAFLGAYRYAEDVKRLIPYLSLNVVINIVTPVLVAIGLFVG
ncbi:MAG: prenyltransferase [Candidatus Latescibacterota bacterium]|nr:MAG: prenyltransferase [Candidatus Latescibacterota bacterium]